MSIRIYTKTGDAGSTSLIGGTKVSKSHLRIEAYGTVDELNSHIGLCRDLIGEGQHAVVLREVQDRLFTMGSNLAQDPGRTTKMQIPDLVSEDVHFLEKEIDRMTEALPEMKNFILPGGHAVSAQVHIARCICRRAERCCVKLHSEEAPVPSIILQYLNRLSDYLFTLARMVAFEAGAEEVVWRARIN